jgi:hypothetical protein
MGWNTSTINYAAGSLTGNTFNMYLCGSAILTILNFLLALAVTGTIGRTIRIAIDYYIAKLTPFPFNEFLTGGGFGEVAVNISIAVFIGYCSVRPTTGGIPATGPDSNSTLYLLSSLFFFALTVVSSLPLDLPDIQIR